MNEVLKVEHLRAIVQPEQPIMINSDNGKNLIGPLVNHMISSQYNACEVVNICSFDNADVLVLTVKEREG